jgi:hypothetical protein
MILPGMAGFQPTPTFDARFLQTATPASPPPCPVVNPDLPLTGELSEILTALRSSAPFDFTDKAVEFLNQGGSPEVLIQAVKAVDPDYIDQQDLTNNGQVEILLKTSSLSILGCSPDGSATYTIYGKFIDEIMLFFSPRIKAVQDLNQNGILELLLITRSAGGFSSAMLLRVVEWDGQGFHSVLGLSPTYPYRMIAEIEYSAKQGEVSGVVYEQGPVEIADLDGNGTTEIIVHSGLPGHHDLLAHGPWRAGKDIFNWNGEAFVLMRSEIDPPVYRFQAVHDADQAALLGEYDESLRLYQEAIFSDKLAGWSPELYQQQYDIVMSRYSTDPTPTPYPASPEEYYHLAAYAYFRILLLHALLDNTVEAQTVYDTLQSEFPEGQPGYESALLGQYFWKALQDTQDVGQACNQALESMMDQTDEIIYWLRDFHGWQSPRYLPIDLCPFRYTGTR